MVVRNVTAIRIHDIHIDYDKYDNTCYEILSPAGYVYRGIGCPEYDIHCGIRTGIRIQIGSIPFQGNFII